MQITRATDYAVRVMVHLAGLPSGLQVRQSELASATGVSGHFLSKVLQQLVRSGLVQSQRGLGGGYVLTASPERVTVLDIVGAMEGPIRLNQCLEPGTSCDRKADCPAHEVWIQAQLAIDQVLGAATIAGLARRSGLQMPSLEGRSTPVLISAFANDQPSKKKHRSQDP